MDAIALSIFVEPAAMPAPRSESSLPGASFGALVAEVTGSGQQDVGGAPDASGDAAPPPSDLMSAIVAQWLAQPDSPAPPISGSEILIDDNSVGDEPTVSPDTTDESALPHSQPPIGAERDVPDADNETAQAPQSASVPADDQPIESEGAPPDKDSTHVAPGARSEESKVPFLQLMQQAAEIGWTLPTSEANRASTELKAKVASESPEGPAPKPPTPTRVAQSDTTFGEDAVETSPNEPAKSAPAPQAAIGEDAKAVDPNQTKTTKASRPDVLELSSSAHAPARAAESLAKSAPNPPANATASAQPQTADTISIPQPTTVSAAAESSSDMPVKLVAASREGQTAEMQTLALHIAARWAKDDSRFTIRLDPPELGQIDVNLSISSHGHAQAVLAVEKPQTLDLLLRDAPTLERALKDAGLELGGNLSFSLKEDGRQNLANDNQHSPPTRTLELVPTEAPKAQAALHASLVEQLYGLRTARLDITV